jgi:hypothetical protein
MIEHLCPHYIGIRFLLAQAVRHKVLGKEYGWGDHALNVVYLLHQAPTTSTLLNSLGARGWQVVPPSV